MSGWHNNVAKRWKWQHDQHWHYRHHPSGTKLARRFIRSAVGDNVAYRKLYEKMTGRELA